MLKMWIAAVVILAAATCSVSGTSAKTDTVPAPVSQSIAFGLPNFSHPATGMIEQELPTGYWATIVARLPAKSEVLTIERDKSLSLGLPESLELRKLVNPNCSSCVEYHLRPVNPALPWDWDFYGPDSTTVLSTDTALTGYADLGFTIKFLLNGHETVWRFGSEAQNWQTSRGKPVVKIFGVIAVLK